MRSLCSLPQAYDLVDSSRLLKVTHGLMMSNTAVPRCENAALSSCVTCLGSPANERATKPQSEMIASRHRSIGGRSFRPAYLSSCPMSAVAENWPLVKPYTPLFSMMYTIGVLRRSICLNWPKPILPVSPSPLTPMPCNVWFAISAPVATDGMRPCSELIACDRLRKYAGLLLEQPMPLNLTMCSGLIESSKQ